MLVRAARRGSVGVGRGSAWGVLAVGPASVCERGSHPQSPRPPHPLVRAALLHDNGHASEPGDLLNSTKADRKGRKGREGKGREGKGREGKGKERKGKKRNGTERKGKERKGKEGRKEARNEGARPSCVRKM